MTSNKGMREMEACIRELERQPGLRSCFTPVSQPAIQRHVGGYIVKTLGRDQICVYPLPDTETLLKVPGSTGYRRR